MTSTNHCVQGLGERNSSRVLRPPGGGSTFNIFGVMPPEDTRPTKGRGTIAPTPEVMQTPAVEQKVEPPTEKQEEKEKQEETEKQEEKEEDKEKQGEKEEVKQEDCTESINNLTIEPSSEENKIAVSSSEENKTESKTNESVKIEAHQNKVEACPVIRGKCKASGFNPITGEPYDKSTQSTNNQPITRVRQPPGGASTKLW